MQFAWRDWQARYRGSMVGAAWGVLSPLLMLLVYTVVFGLIFNRHWAGEDEGLAEFAVQIFSGLIVFNWFSETVGRCPDLVVRNRIYVTKLRFPLECLPVITLLSNGIQFLISLIVLLVVSAWLHGGLSWTALLIPLVLLPLVPMTLGIGWFLAALGVYLRDANEVVSLGLRATLFLSAIFYPLSAIPERWQWIMTTFNPLPLIIDQLRAVLLRGECADVIALSSYSASAALVAVLGLLGFQKARRGFADVL